mgnify:CR=1 FL=1|tara:strand:- start:3792 stop:4229 length:438 start_codon:yes stop_codon:yes gene_type:complete
MCTWQAALMGVGTAMQMSAAKKAGEAQKEIADLNARNALIEKSQNELQARQIANDTLFQLDEDMKVAQTMFAFNNREMPSEFLKGQQEVAYTNMDRALLSSNIRSNASLAKANQELLGGQYAIKNAKVQQQSLLLNGVYRMTQIV